MKKHLIFFLAVLLVLSSAVASQAANNDLNLLTVGHLFKWNCTSQDVYDILGTLGDFEIEVGEDSDLKYMAIEGSNEEKAFFYQFYFDLETDLLSEVEFLDICYDDDATLETAAAVIDAYDLDSVPAYEDDFTIEYTTGFDGAMTVAGDKTICILAGSDPTDDQYGYVSLVFLNRAD